MHLKKNQTLTLSTSIFVLLVCIYMVSHRIWFSPDQFFILAIIASLFLGRSRQFVADWGPFLGFFLGYEFLRSLIPYVSKNVHIFPMIRFDNFVFGYLPTIKLQTLFYNPAHIQWYDYIAVTLYICHFVAFMGVGFIFWLRDRKYFKKYAEAVLILSYITFFTYLIFPAMPPWMAAQQGIIPPVKEVISVVMAHFMQTKLTLPSVYSFLGADPVAAMPSLHAALPTLIFWFVYKKSRPISLLILPYVFGVYFSVIYLGEHYFADVAAGIVYATAIFFLLELRSKKMAKNDDEIAVTG